MPPLVLDTNVFIYAPTLKIEALAQRGLQLRISEIALVEAVGHAYREHVEGDPRAFEAFLARVRRIDPYLDGSNPVALGGANLVRRISAEVEGQPLPAAGEQWAANLQAKWRSIVRDGMTDEEWRTLGPGALTMLDDLDKSLADAAPRDDGGEEGEDRVRLAWVRWGDIPEEERRRAHRKYTRIVCTDPTADRLDGHICALMYRIYGALTGARPTKVNDGADIQLTIHVGEGAVVVTNERHLVTLIDEAGTYQAPWVRRLDELDQLPDGPPWGENARSQARTFTRERRARRS